MSALKRFAAGFATSLAQQNREDKLLAEEAARQKTMFEDRLKAEQKYKERVSFEENGDDVFEVIRMGDGSEVNRRKLSPSEVTARKAEARKAEAELKEADRKIKYGDRDYEDARKRSLEEHNSQLAYRRNAGAAMGGRGAGREQSLDYAVQTALDRNKDNIALLIGPEPNTESMSEEAAAEATKQWNQRYASEMLRIEELARAEAASKGITDPAAIASFIQKAILEQVGGSPNTALMGLDSVGVGILNKYKGKR